MARKKDIFEEKKDKDIWWQDSRKNGKKVIISILILLLITLMAGLTFLVLSLDQKNKLNQKETDKLKQEFESSQKNALEETDLLQQKLSEAQKKLDDIEKEKIEKANQRVIIEGSLSYPSSAIPEDMEICAQDLENSQNLVCTKEHLTDKKYKYGVGYKLEVALGTYNVYATVPAWQNYKAYYDEFVTCGMKYGCTSYEPIKVKAENGKNLSDIDPIDWYKQ